MLSFALQLQEEVPDEGEEEMKRKNQNRKNIESGKQGREREPQKISYPSFRIS